jgi:hypothetical protein
MARWIIALANLKPISFHLSMSLRTTKTLAKFTLGAQTFSPCLILFLLFFSLLFLFLYSYFSWFFFLLFANLLCLFSHIPSLGLHPNTTKEEVRQCLTRFGVHDDMYRLLNVYPIVPNDGWYIKPGMLSL